MMSICKNSENMLVTINQIQRRQKGDMERVVLGHNEWAFLQEDNIKAYIF